MPDDLLPVLYDRPGFVNSDHETRWLTRSATLTRLVTGVLMAPSDLSSDIGRRFHRPPVPSAIACLQSKDPITFSHVASGSAMPAPTLAPPLENSFALHVHHAPLFRGDIWIQGRHRRMPVVPVAGVFVFDLRTEPLHQVHEPFDISRFHISRATMDELAFELGIGQLDDLRAEAFVPDFVLTH